MIILCKPGTLARGLAEPISRATVRQWKKALGPKGVTAARREWKALLPPERRIPRGHFNLFRTNSRGGVFAPELS